MILPPPTLLALCLMSPTPVGALAGAAQDEPGSERLRLVRSEEAEPIGPISRGHFLVDEDRGRPGARTLSLDVVVLHARGESPRPDPVFWIAGGPGQNAAELWRGHVRSWIREERDMVFVSQRGTGGDHRLDVELGRGDGDLQRELDPLFELEAFRAAKERLSLRHDLRQYSTPNAMDDLDELRAALGAAQINLFGGSYGTRASLIYLRRHPEHARCAVLNGVAPLAFENPLFHAAAFQRALELLFDEVESTPAAAEAFPRLRERFAAILDRMDRDPVAVACTPPGAPEEIVLELGRESFLDALRILMYSTRTSRDVPLLLHRAAAGDFEPFVLLALQSNRNLRRSLALGMLMCVTAAEDCARISEEEIVRHTGGTVLGDRRVRAQRAIAAIWPKSELPADFADEVTSPVPVLLLSGSMDPVTPPEFGELAHRALPNSLHVVVPGAHGVGGPGLRRLTQQFLDRAAVDGLDLGFVEELRLPPLRLR